MSFILREAEKIICAVLFLAMTFLGFANVVVRYGTHYSLAASEELLTNGFLLLTVFGAAIAARRGEHLAVTLVHDLLPRPLQRVVFGLSLLLTALLLGLSAWYSWQAVTNLMDNGMRSYALGIPAWYYQAAVPFGFALVLVRYLQHAVEMLRGTASEGIPDV
ncbi:TRAP transporter small permease [Salipiger marinus]|jgi:TRAP-type C4-dicarboxylate transport system permease small subunit|uniref:TRAP transporter small permease n=1 Tax=Salipiger marinus TaxID=555512 RepID=UPI000E7DB57E|nr:TRAP transporter small permease [Salipiger manganoxidans]MCD1618529.1 TRAP transporter small permease [Salipiger manganoxidans]MEB3417744.1 TRAP transporter small permease [Salipiger manganoxidans]HBM59277.1 TRAP transporter small permease [Citreicella sp.]HBT02868.1 TRAP transporter small permease [Citreicella sp.]|tara:strand:+ start:42 stop:527 length:486 start_codon:yes stop_codon:yes gene_type:complete